MYETLRDNLSVGPVEVGHSVGRYGIYWWGQDIAWPTNRIATFPREDEAWGVVSLILEYVEEYGFSPGYAIDRALTEYREACADDRPLDSEPDADELGRMAHAHEMATA